MKKTTSTNHSAKKENGGAKKTGKPTDDKTMLKEFFIDCLKDVYWAEKLLVKSIPKMEKAATSEALKDAFASHLEETQNQVSQLEEVFDLLNVKVQGKKCEAMEGIVKEAEGIIEETEDGTYTRDVALIMAAQKVEHYEIATYGGMAQLARTMGETEVAEILDGILDEEKGADQVLTRIAEERVNTKASVEEEELENAEEEE